MNSLIDRLREAKTLDIVDPILRELGANGPIRKLVEASILQRMNPNPASYQYGISMLNEAIKELEKDEEPSSPESPGLKVKGDHFVKEEELANHNPNGQGAGSEQSTSNTGLSMEGTQKGDEDMTSAPDTENQMSETDGESPFPKNISEEMNGLHPDIAKTMGAKMPTIPPMNAGDQMKQTRYTIQKYHETIVVPLLKHAKVQDAAIRKLSNKIRETEARSGTYTLDMDKIKQNAPAQVRETIPVTNPLEAVSYSRIPNKDFELNQARNEIRAANNMMSS